MKKILIAILVCITMTMSLTACGGAQPEAPAASETVAESSAPELTTEPAAVESKTETKGSEAEELPDLMPPMVGNAPADPDTECDDAYLVACIIDSLHLDSYREMYGIACLIWNQAENDFYGSTVRDAIYGIFPLNIQWYTIPETSVPGYLYYIENGPSDLSLTAAYAGMANRDPNLQYCCEYAFYEENADEFIGRYGEKIGNLWVYSD